MHEAAPELLTVFVHCPEWDRSTSVRDRLLEGRVDELNVPAPVLERLLARR
jgi:hypothetical protein